MNAITMNAQNQATVIIPCFNVEEYIEECLDSVALQGNTVHHTYVVDNNSTDKTIDKVRDWQTTNPSFPLTVLFESKPGASAARNCPLSLVRTKWVQFLDADDLLVRNKIENQVNKFPFSDVIYAGFERLDLSGKREFTFPNPDVSLALLQGSAGITSANLFSTKSIRSAGGWKESLKSSQEYDLMFRIWKTGGAFEDDSRPRAVIRTREYGQISQQNPKEKWTQFIDLRMKMLDEMFHLHTRQQEKQEMLQVVFDFVRILFPLDWEKAASTYEMLKTIGLKPRKSATCSWKYILATRIFGVVRTEKLRLQLTKIIVKS